MRLLFYQTKDLNYFSHETFLAD